jgi:hypothetical protein
MIWRLITGYPSGMMDATVPTLNGRMMENQVG